MSYESKIKKFMQTTFFDRKSDRNFSETDNLIETGIIDSLGIFKLVTFIEETLDLKVESDDLVAENFETIEAIVAFVNNKQNT